MFVLEVLSVFVLAWLAVAFLFDVRTASLFARFGAVAAVVVLAGMLLGAALSFFALRFGVPIAPIVKILYSALVLLIGLAVAYVATMRIRPR